MDILREQKEGDQVELSGKNYFSLVTRLVPKVNSERFLMNCLEITLTAEQRK